MSVSDNGNESSSSYEIQATHVDGHDCKLAVPACLYRKYLRAYIVPSFKFSLVFMAKHLRNYKDTKIYLKNVLKACAERRQIRNKFQQTISNVVYMQRTVKKYLGKKQFWCAALKIALLDELERLRNFLRDLPRERQAEADLRDLSRELAQLQDNKVAINTVCMSIINLYKDIQVLDMYRYHTEVLGKAPAAERISECTEYILLYKDMICPPEYAEHLKKYPAVIWRDPNNKTVPAKRRRQAIKPSWAGLKQDASKSTLGTSESEVKLGIARTAQRELANARMARSPDDRDTIEYATSDQIRAVYKQLHIPMKSFVVKRETLEPRINVDEIVDRMRRRPGELAKRDRAAEIEELESKGADVPIARLKYQDPECRAVVYEFSAFSELLILAIIESKVDFKNLWIRRREEKAEYNRRQAEYMQKQLEDRLRSIVTGAMSSN